MRIAGEVFFSYGPKTSFSLLAVSAVADALVRA